MNTIKSNLPERIKEIVDEHCAYCHAGNSNLTQCDQDVEEQYNAILSAIREYVEDTIDKNMNTITYYTAEQKDEQGVYNATFEKAKQVLLKDLSQPLKDEGEEV